MYKGDYKFYSLTDKQSVSFLDVTVEVVGNHIRVTDRVQKPNYVDVELLGIFPLDKFYMIRNGNK